MFLFVCRGELAGAVRSSEIKCSSPSVQLPISSRRIELIEYLKNCLTEYLKLLVRILKMRTVSATPDNREPWAWWMGRTAWKGGEVQ